VGPAEAQQFNFINGLLLQTVFESVFEPKRVFSPVTNTSRPVGDDAAPLRDGKSPGLTFGSDTARCTPDSGGCARPPPETVATKISKCRGDPLGSIFWSQIRNLSPFWPSPKAPAPLYQFWRQHMNRRRSTNGLDRDQGARSARWSSVERVHHLPSARRLRPRGVLRVRGAGSQQAWRLREATPFTIRCGLDARVQSRRRRRAPARAHARAQEVLSRPSSLSDWG
jgi:hypothetical protein